MKHRGLANEGIAITAYDFKIFCHCMDGGLWHKNNKNKEVGYELATVI